MRAWPGATLMSLFPSPSHKYESVHTDEEVCYLFLRRQGPKVARFRNLSSFTQECIVFHTEVSALAGRLMSDTVSRGLV